jgi:stage IV sporulation protein FB
VFGIISIIALGVMFAVSGNALLLIIPLLIGFELFNENKHEKIRNYLKQERVNYYTDYPNLPDKDYWFVRDCLIFSFPRKYGIIKPGVHEYTILEPMLVQHVSSVLKVNLKFDLNLVKRLLVLVFYIVITLAPVFLFLSLKSKGS